MKTKEKIKDWLNMFMFVVGIGLLIFSIAIYSKGFHNVDLTFNFLKISNEAGEDYSNCYDQYNTKGDVKGCNEFYILGHKYMEISLYTMLIAGIMLGSSINNIRWRKYEN